MSLLLFAWPDLELPLVFPEAVDNDRKDSDRDSRLLDILVRAVALGTLRRPLLLLSRSCMGFDVVSSSSSDDKSIVLMSTNPGRVIRLALSCLADTILLNPSDFDRDNF